MHVDIYISIYIYMYISVWGQLLGSLIFAMRSLFRVMAPKASLALTMRPARRETAGLLARNLNYDVSEAMLFMYTHKNFDSVTIIPKPSYLQ